MKITHNGNPIMNISKEGTTYSIKLLSNNFKDIRAKNGLPIHSRKGIASLKLAILHSLHWIKKNSSEDINSFILTEE